MDVRLVLDERLRAVAVMNVPVDDQHSSRPVLLPRVVRRERNVAEKAEAHRAVAQRVMTRRSHGAERSQRSTPDIARSTASSTQPAPAVAASHDPSARHRIVVEPPATRLGAISRTEAM